MNDSFLSSSVMNDPFMTSRPRNTVMRTVFSLPPAREKLAFQLAELAAR